MSLDNSERREEGGGGGGGPLYSPLGGLEPLHRHQEEAARQHLLTPATTWQQQARLTWDLVAALWGRLDSQVGMMGGKKKLGAGVRVDRIE